MNEYLPSIPSDVMSYGGGWLIPVAVAALILFFVIVGRKVVKPPLQYTRVKLFSPAELNFYRALDRAVGKEFRILGKIRIADVVNPKKSLPYATRKKLFYPIAAKHFDFVLCRSDTLDPVVVIELNDKSHEEKDRKQRDVLVGKVCTAGKIPLVWYPAAKYYKTEEILMAIKASVDAVNGKDVK